MSDAPGLIERAYELARSGDFADLDAVRRQLKLEQYSAIEQHLSGSLIKRQLRALLAKPSA